MSSEGQPRAAHLPSADSHLSIRILEDALEKFELLEAMQSLQDHSSTDELSQRIGDEISAVIQEQKDLQHKYAELVVQRATLTGYSNTEKLKTCEEEIKEVANGLNKKSKQLSRTLISNPNISENLLKIQKERALLQRIFTITISELRSYPHNFQTLEQTVVGDKKDRHDFDELKANEKSSREELATLKKNLENEHRQHQLDVNERNETTMKLKVDLHDLRNKSQMETTYLQKETGARLNSTDRTFQQRITDLNSEIRLMEQKVARERKVCEGNSFFLKKKTKELSEMGAEWQDHYEDVKEKKEAELDKLTKDEDTTRNTLEETVGRYNTENSIKKSLIAEDERREENRIRMEKERELKEAAALQLQRAWPVSYTHLTLPTKRIV
eukprot:TRINITY_DN13476_c0_g1_i1.p1 TRINITY_DN13476_c0_g1~~TRINITY_DN13476_c0_g1_i1.p1  ORF type:complete len:385 (+),score=123.32 TRINITY_DN13476_c0_g1_i1:203-1357(+)